MYLVAWLYLVFSTGLTNALFVASGSPCAVTCQYPNGTGWQDLVCSDSNFVSDTKGQLVQDCLKCERQSLYINGTESDEYWYMFHMKYTQQACLIDTAIPHTAAIQACATECAPLRQVLDTLWVSKKPYLPQYNYCTLDANAYPTYAPKCGECLQAQAGTVVLGNMVQTMASACVDQPLAANGSLVKSTRDIFNSTVIPLTDATSSNTTSSNTISPKPATDDSHGLGAATAAGIGVGSALILIIAVIGALYVRRRMKRSHTHDRIEEPAPVYYEGRDVKDKKHGKYYREMHTEPIRLELYGHETMEADSRPAGKAAPIAELPVSPYR